eukprot:UN03655
MKKQGGISSGELSYLHPFSLLSIDRLYFLSFAEGGEDRNCDYHSDAASGSSARGR